MKTKLIPGHFLQFDVDRNNDFSRQYFPFLSYVPSFLLNRHMSPDIQSYVVHNWSKYGQGGCFSSYFLITNKALVKYLTLHPIRQTNNYVATVPALSMQTD